MKSLSLRRFLDDESGPAAAEYAVLLAFILLGVIGAITAVGNSTADVWQDDVEKIQGAIGS